MKKAPEIPQYEWDFREVPDAEIRVAYEWEIHREIKDPEDPSPYPWLAIEPSSASEYSAGVEKFCTAPAVQVIPTGKSAEAWSTRILLRISPLNHSRDEIIESVLAAIKASGLQPNGGKRGMGGKRPRTELLKRLSAFRLKKFGLTFEAAQKFLRGERDRAKLTGWPAVWPVYSDSPAWSKAIAAVAKDIEIDQRENEKSKVLTASENEARRKLS